jgi:hypothetical protein
MAESRGNKTNATLTVRTAQAKTVRRAQFTVASRSDGHNQNVLSMVMLR